MQTIGYYSGPAHDQAAWVPTDVPCRRCQSNLRGQHVGARCPACGTPVGLTFYGDLLQYAPAAWLGAVRDGLFTIFWTLISIGVLTVVAAGGGAVLASRASARGATTTPADLEWLQIAVSAIAFVGALVLLLGAWRLTAPDPSPAAEARSGSIRRVVRTCLTIGCLKSLLDVAAPFLGVHAAAPGVVWVVAGIVLMAVQLVGWLAQAHYVGILASRVPDPSMTQWAKVIVWGTGICAGIIILSSVLMVALMGEAFASHAAEPRPANFNSLIAFGCVSGLASLAVCVFAILYLVLLIRMAGRVKQAAEYSTQVWAQPFGVAAVSAPAPAYELPPLQTEPPQLP